MIRSDELDLKAITGWFEHLGFKLYLTHEAEGLVWAELGRTPDGPIVVPMYGHGDTEIAAARRAKERYEEEQ